MTLLQRAIYASYATYYGMQVCQQTALVLWSPGIDLVYEHVALGLSELRRFWLMLPEDVEPSPFSMVCLNPSRHPTARVHITRSMAEDAAAMLQPLAPSVATLVDEHAKWARDDTMDRSMAAHIFAFLPLGELRDAWRARFDATLEPSRAISVDSRGGLRGGMLHEPLDQAELEDAADQVAAHLHREGTRRDGATVAVDESEGTVDCTRVELETLLGDETLARLFADGRIEQMAHGDKLRFDEPFLRRVIHTINARRGIARARDAPDLQSAAGSSSDAAVARTVPPGSFHQSSLLSRLLQENGLNRWLGFFEANEYDLIRLRELHASTPQSCPFPITHIPFSLTTCSTSDLQARVTAVCGTSSTPIISTTTWVTASSSASMNLSYIDCRTPSVTFPSYFMSLGSPLTRQSG